MPISGVDSRPLVQTSSLESRPTTPVSGMESRLRTPASSLDSCPDTPGSSGTECCPCTAGGGSEPRPCPPASGRNIMESRKSIPATIQECHPATPPNSLKSDSQNFDSDNGEEPVGANALVSRPGTPASSMENRPPTPDTPTAIATCPQHSQQAQQQSCAATTVVATPSSSGLEGRSRGSIVTQRSFRSHSLQGPPCHQRPKLRTPATSVESRPRTPGSTRCVPRGTFLPVYGEVTR